MQTSAFTRRLAPLALAAAALAVASAPAQAAVNFTAFSFESVVSPSGAFGGVNGIHGNGDVRLDSVSFNGGTLNQSSLQTVADTRIVLDDGPPPSRPTVPTTTSAASSSPAKPVAWPSWT